LESVGIIRRKAPSLLH